MEFKDKVVIVTGGSSGIGAATAIKFAAYGAKVVIVGRNEAKLKNVKEECERNGGKPLVIVADVTEDSDARRIVSDTIAHFGKIDCLVNNAGIAGSSSILESTAMELFDKIMTLNLRAAVYITHLAAPHLIETKGNIVNISSIASTSIIDNNQHAYSAAKAALDHFSRCIALELAPKGVRVNTINPGPVRTDIIDNMVGNAAYSSNVWDHLSNVSPLKRIGDSEEIADLVLFVASDKARSITGSSFVSDNGFILKGSFN